MRSLVSVIVLGSMSKIVTGDLYVQGMSCQIKHHGFSWTGSCVENGAVDFSHPFLKAPECAQVSPHAWCAIAEIPCEYRLQGGLCMNPVSSCSSTTFTSAQFNYYMNGNNKLVYLCPGGLTCCINGRIAAPQPRLNLPLQSFSGPLDSGLLPQDPSSNDNLWANDDSQSDTASLLTDPSNDGAYYDAFLDPAEPNSDFPDPTNNDWMSMFNDPGDGADYSIQGQFSDSEDPFQNAIGLNPYPNGPLNELASIIDDPSQGADFAVPDQSLG